MSFLTSLDEVLGREDQAVRSFASMELVDEAGLRHTVSPEFTQVVRQVLSALGDGKVVHVDIEEPLVSPERAAEMLGVSRPTIYAWQDRGRLERVDQGNRRMVPAVDIERYKLEQQERAAWRSSIDVTGAEQSAVDAAAETFAGTLDLSKDASVAPQRRRRPRREPRTT
jgi:excisionase family DNA binding protein